MILMLARKTTGGKGEVLPESRIRETNEEVEEKPGIVVVIQWKVYQDQLVDHLEDELKKSENEDVRGLLVMFKRKFGELSVTQRDKTVAQFQDAEPEKVPLLFLSKKSGGVAISLTRAKYLILGDPDWNPSNDEQAVSRVHRINQNKNVTIFRIHCAGTMEEYMLDRQDKKQDNRGNWKRLYQLQN